MVKLIDSHTLTQTNPRLVDYAGLFISSSPCCVDPFPLDG